MVASGPGRGALVVGIDSSTQSTKAEAREMGSGRVVASGTAPHPSTQPPRSEQDPLTWWEALVAAVTALGGCRRDVVAISVGGQQHGLVVSDDAGEPVRPAKLWNDTESAPQAERLVEELGADAWAAAVGSVPVAAFTVTKLAWLVETEPALLDRITHVALPHDWLTWRLCGEHISDRGDSSGTGWYDAASALGDPAAVRSDLLSAAVSGAPGELADASGWLDRLPRVLGPTEAAGTLTPSAAAVLGLPTGTAVGPGTGDNMAAALGLGLRDGDVTFSLGTSGTVYSVASDRTTDPSGAVTGFADATGRFLPLVCTLNATKVTDTVAEWLGVDATGLAQLALAADPTKADRPGLLPYFDGERTPDLPGATGTFTGLRNDTTREDLALAAHDGVLRGLIGGLEALQAAGVPADGMVNLVGGGARSSAYRRRLADLLGRPVRVPAEQEAVAAGAAVQAVVVASAARMGGPDAPILSAVGDGDPFGEVAARWDLGAGPVIDPRPQTR